MNKEASRLIIGIIIGLIVGFLVFKFIIPASESEKSQGEERTIFTNEDVHLLISKDFATGVKPTYNEDYCKKKFLEAYQKDASSCTIKSIITLTRMNPYVKDVECSCV